MYTAVRDFYEENTRATPDLDPPQEPHWEYYPLLKFLDQHIKHKKYARRDRFSRNDYKQKNPPNFSRTTLGAFLKKEDVDVRFLDYVEAPLCETPSPNGPTSPQFASNKKRRRSDFDPMETVKCELAYSPPSPVPSTSSSCSSRKKKIKEEDAEPKRFEDGDELFGRLVAAELMKIDDDNVKRMKKRDILNVLYT